MYRCGATLVYRTVCTGVGQHLYIGQYVQVCGNTCVYGSMYRCRETLVCTAMCTGVGKHVQQYVQVWENICMYNSMYKYGETFVQQYVQMWGNICMYRCGENLYVQQYTCTGVGKTCKYNSMYSVGKLFRILPSHTRLCESEGF